MGEDNNNKETHTCPSCGKDMGNEWLDELLENSMLFESIISKMSDSPEAAVQLLAFTAGRMAAEYNMDENGVINDVGIGVEVGEDFRQFVEKEEIKAEEIDKTGNN